MRGGGGTTSGRLFEVLLAWGTGVLAASVVACLRLVVPEASGRPDAAALRQTLWMIAMACVPFGFLVVLPFGFRVGNLLASRRAWWYFLSFVLAAGLSWVATRWMFGGLQ